MTEPAPRLLPRSAGATADLELLRVARTDIDERDAPVSPSVAARIRGMASVRIHRPHVVARAR